jgi:arylsulfatase A-like enzyme
MTKTATVRVCIATSLLLTAFISSSAFSGPEVGNKPNVIIILLDAARKDHLGLYGYTRNTTPNLDLLAPDSVVFTNAVTECPWTNPAIASLFTSLPPSAHGVTSYHMGKVGVETDCLNREIKTLAEILKEAGYRTGAFVANHWIGEKTLFDQGFDVFDPLGPEFKPRAARLNKKALAWIEKNRGGPFFAYLHYFDIHGPYQPPEPYDTIFHTVPPAKFTTEQLHAMDAHGGGYISDGREKDGGNLSYYIDKYDGEIRYVDSRIGGILSRLKELSLYDDSLIIVLSDHGEVFFEHGYYGHGYSIYSEEINIALIIKFPAKLGFQGRSGAAVSLADISTTIFEILGLRFPYPTVGQSLLGEPAKNGTAGRDLFSEELSPIMKGAPKVALIKGDLKAIYRPNQSAVTEIYDLSKDPAEKSNLLKSNPALAAAMKKEIEARLEDGRELRIKLGLIKSTAVIKDQKKIDQLRALGYIN